MPGGRQVGGHAALAFCYRGSDRVAVYGHDTRAIEQAQMIRVALDRLLGPDVALRAMFMGRIGAGKPAEARSIRLPLERLMQLNVERTR